MVFFICNNCNESLNKNQIKKHLLNCKNCLFTCIDCQKVFNNKSIKLHLNCFDENEKEFGIINYIAMANKIKNKNLISSTTSQQPDISFTSLGTSINIDKKSDRMKQLLEEIDDEIEKKNEQKSDKDLALPNHRTHKLSPINPTKFQSKARRKILQTIPETPEKLIGNLSKRELEEDSFEIVKQTPLSKISSENSSLASKLSELLLKEEARLDKPQRKRKLKEDENENKIITNREILEHFIQNKNIEEEEELIKQINLNKRKRQITPSEINFTNNLKQLQMAKKPRRRLFSSHSSSNNSICFPGKNDEKN
ncbi:hypothetical protein ACQ4LE_001906 [Meloidogyne hapla]|uniref:Zf-LYAR domain-containing protein n=1 Tax=Meloidogyne hapla TaxID=6305 RepID=A0A1I8B9K1_MELHA